MDALHFLVLDSDGERRRGLAETLRGAGHRVFDTGDSRAAAGSLEAGGFDGLALSLSLPGLDSAGLRSALCPSAPESPVSLETAERLHIARTLEHTGGNRRRAALILGVARSTLLHKIRKYGLDSTIRRR